MALTQRDANRVIENIIDDIKQYVEPEDIFDEDKLKAWAKAKEVDDIFDADELEYWAQGDKMHIRCVCMNAIDVNLLDFGTTYVSCQKCGREYEITSEFSLVVDVDEEDCASTEQPLQPDSTQ